MIYNPVRPPEVQNELLQTSCTAKGPAKGKEYSLATTPCVNTEDKDDSGPWLGKTVGRAGVNEFGGKRAVGGARPALSGPLWWGMGNGRGQPGPVGITGFCEKCITGVGGGGESLSLARPSSRSLLDPSRGLRETCPLL